MFARDWRVELAEGWTKEMAWNVVNSSETIITLAPTKDVPLVFRRRKAE
jgi:hypothetical protein